MNDMRIEQVIEELKAERDEIKAKNKAAGQMIENFELDHEQNLLLSMQMSAYKTVAHVLGARIRSLEKQVPVIEKPKKVVLTKEQAKIVEGAHNDIFSAGYISSKSDDERLLMNAYVNGYTVANEKKYNVKVPKQWSGDDKHYWVKEQNGSLTWACLINKGYMMQFTESEIEQYGLQDCEKVEAEK